MKTQTLRGVDSKYGKWANKNLDTPAGVGSPEVSLNMRSSTVEDGERRLVFYIVPCCSFPLPHQPSIAFTPAKQCFTQHLASRNKTREFGFDFGNEG